MTVFSSYFAVGMGTGGGMVDVDSFTGPGTLATRSAFLPFGAFTEGVSLAVLAGGQLAVGTASGSSHVKLFDITTPAPGLTASFLAFPGFTGGVDLSWFDAGHLAVGSGPGGGPHVKTFDTSGLSTTASFFAFDPTFAGGVDVAWLDATHLAVGTSSLASELKIFELPGVTPVFASLPFGAGFTGGLHLAGSADGRLAVGAASGSPHVKVLDATGNVLASFFAFDPATYSGGVDVAWLDLTHLAVSQVADATQVRIFDLSSGSPILVDAALAFPAFTGGAHVANIGDLPSGSIADVNQAEGTGGTTAVTFTVMLDHASISHVWLNYATADGSATVAGGDFTAVGGTLVFDPGETSKTITVMVNADGAHESDETFSLNLSAPNNAGLATSSATATIQNDDPQHLFGTPGDDAFDVLPGHVLIDALGGNDTITFNFRLVDATVSHVGNTIVVDGPGSHTVLTGFEVFNFTDGTVNNNDGIRLIDDLFYYSKYHDVWNAHVDADAHFISAGRHEGRDPSFFFSTLVYRSANPDVAVSGVNPLDHFDTFGWHEGRLPSITFDPAQYLAANPDVAAAHVDPLRHYLQFGYEEGRLPFAPTELVTANGFDYVYYLNNNPDVADAGIDPLQHFQTVGWHEGRNPNALFDVNGYLSTYGDVAAAHINPLDHYNQFGWLEGRDPSPGFDTTSYLAAYPDVAAAHVNPLTHFLHFGVHEGRSAFADGVWG